MTEVAPSKSEPRWLRVVGLLGRLIAGGVFIYAGVHKLLDPVQFAEDIANYQAFPHWTWHLAAGIVPAAEIIAGLAVLTNFKRRAGAIVLGSLTLAFLGLILSIIVRDIDLACGCFGKAAEASEVGWPLFFRDLGLLVAIVAAYLPSDER
ncbi:MAG: DoxX family protein [Myxococcales bacterium]|nr:DoxX family protein [Myxococcales bacterium]